MSRTPIPPRLRFWPRVDTSGECWVWTGGRTKAGYGLFHDGTRQTTAHRWAYEQAVGPVPDGYDVHHECVNPPCVRADHLRAMTRAENNSLSNSRSAINARRTHCQRGHELTQENTYQRPSGGRTCRACWYDGDYQRAYRAANKAKLAAYYRSYYLANKSAGSKTCGLCGEIGHNRRGCAK